MNGTPIIIRDKPSALPLEPAHLKAWVITSDGKRELIGKPATAVCEIDRPLILDPAFEMYDEIVLSDPMQAPGYNIQQSGFVPKQVVCARRLLVPMRHLPTAHTVELRPVYLFRLSQLSDTDLEMAFEHWIRPLGKLIDDIAEAHSRMTSRLVRAGAMPPLSRQ